MQMLTIGNLAKQANVNVQTVRYYERRRLRSMVPEHRISAGDRHQAVPEFVGDIVDVARRRHPCHTGQPVVEEGQTSSLGTVAFMAQP